MITDKDREIAKAYLEKIFRGKHGSGSCHGINDKWSESELIEMQAERDSRIRSESAEQAMKEAADRAIAFVDNNIIGLADCDVGSLTDLRAVILGSNISTHYEKLIDEISDETARGFEALNREFEAGSISRKLDIAVKENHISTNALKEVQG